MPAPVRNNKGFTLVEVLVSLVILAVGLLGSLLAVKVAVESTQQNAMRFEAIKIAQQQAEMARNMNYAAIQAIASPQTVKRQVRKAMADFRVTTTKTPVTGFATRGITRLTIKVEWLQKTKWHSYALDAVVRQMR